MVKIAQMQIRYQTLDYSQVYASRMSYNTMSEVPSSISNSKSGTQRSALTATQKAQIADFSSKNGTSDGDLLFLNKVDLREVFRTSSSFNSSNSLSFLMGETEVNIFRSLIIFPETSDLGDI